MNVERWLDMGSSFPLVLGWLFELQKKIAVLEVFSIDKHYWIRNIYIYG